MTATGPALPATSGTPKKGVDCARCDDWGTVLVVVGGRSREELCPQECQMARRVQELRGEERS